VAKLYSRYSYSIASYDSHGYDEGILTCRSHGKAYSTVARAVIGTDRPPPSTVLLLRQKQKHLRKKLKIRCIFSTIFANRLRLALVRTWSKSLVNCFSQPLQCPNFEIRKTIVLQATLRTNIVPYGKLLLSSILQLVLEPEGKISVGRSSSKLENNITMNLA
jgi:hypothetical protein